MNNSPGKIILIANYKLDRQESMLRFARRLERGFKQFGHETTTWYPITFFGNFKFLSKLGLYKWVGYIDKWVLSVISLRVHVLMSSRHTRYHICDHSNAPYLAHLPKDRTSITCHDVLAIQAGLGDESAYCEISKTGQIYQKWILKNLLNAKKLVAVSQYTYDELIKLAKPSNKNYSSWTMIYNGFDKDFFVIDKQEAHKILQQGNINLRRPFLLHVGSSLVRKNRALLVNMLLTLDNSEKFDIIYAGEKIDDELKTLITQNKLERQVISIVGPNHETLLALYNLCAAFIFPSLSEGFGMPLVEAQACGRPVITSRKLPMTEVCEDSALYANPFDPKEFGVAFTNLSDKLTEDSLIQKGLKNITRFDVEKMFADYLVYIN